MTKKLTMRLLEGKYGVCRLDKGQSIPEWPQKGEFFSITNTADELSIVCMENYIPKEEKFESDWRILKIEGPLDFSLIGILSSISSVLAQNGISIFAISTYDTDYILVKENNLEKAVQVLDKEGYEIIS